MEDVTSQYFSLHYGSRVTYAKNLIFDRLCSFNCAEIPTAPNRFYFYVYLIKPSFYTHI